MNHIRLDPKHGLNPSMGICFFCGGDTGEIALVGFNKGEEAPRKTVISYDPCNTCKEHMSRGLTVIECADQPNGVGQPPIQKDSYPTSRFSVIKLDSRLAIEIKQTYGENCRHIFMHPDIYAMFFGETPKEKVN